MRTRFFFWLLFAVLPVASLVGDDQSPGEFTISAVSPLQPRQLEVLRDLVTSDPEARKLADAVQEKAEPLLDAEPQPLEVIHYEGLVNTDPRRIATVAKLRDMADVARLMRYWQASADPEAAAALRKYILAWTRSYQLTGNDVNENKFYPLLVAYEALRDTFSEQQRQEVDRWVERLGTIHSKAVAESDHFTNRYSKHVRLAAIAGLILDRRKWIETAHQGIKRFVTQSLYEDGSSFDFKRRDTLTYHMSALRPPIELAMLAGDRGAALYRWTSPVGGSLQKSVEFVVPYAMGEKSRREWSNSKVGLDRRRAEAGLEKYRRGRLFNPQEALELMEEASYFDPSLKRVVKHLTGSSAEQFPTWRTVINEAARDGLK